MAERGESGDAEAARAEELKGDGGLVLELVGLSVDQFESVCRAVRRLDLEHAVDADGHLAVEAPSPTQIDDLRRLARHGRRDLDAAVLARLRSRRGTRTIAVDDLTLAERDEVVSSLAADGHLAVVDDLDVVVERRGATAAERHIDDVLDSDLEERDDEDEGSDERSTRGRGSGGATSADGLPLAPYPKRLLGFAIDATAFFAVSLALSLLAGLVGVPPVTGLLMGIAAWFVTSTIMHARTGQTLGKSRAGTRVVDASTHGDVTLARSTTRGLIQFGPVVLGAGGILVAVAIHAAIMLLPDRQGLHDRLARTLVIVDDPDAPT